MSKLQDVENAVVSGKSKLVAGLVQEALDEGCSAPDILNGMINAMGIVGERFKKNEIFVPEMLVAARAMKKGVDVLKPPEALVFVEKQLLELLPVTFMISEKIWLP